MTRSELLPPYRLFRTPRQAMGQFYEFSPNVQMAGTTGGGVSGKGMGCSSTVHGDFFDGPEASVLWMPWKGQHRGDAQDLMTTVGVLPHNITAC